MVRREGLDGEEGGVRERRMTKQVCTEICIEYGISVASDKITTIPLVCRSETADVRHRCTFYRLLICHVSEGIGSSLM